MTQEINSIRFRPPQHVFSEAHADRALKRNYNQIHLKHRQNLFIDLPIGRQIHTVFVFASWNAMKEFKHLNFNFTCPKHKKPQSADKLLQYS